jgi:hypothetical protein
VGIISNSTSELLPEKFNENSSTSVQKLQLIAKYVHGILFQSFEGVNKCGLLICLVKISGAVLV